ncbi:MAG: hypothetical protein M1340_07760 [Actinobacteria bacterium]|nr:hypothetical protein [Actinomycetota bacterium]
MAAKFNLQMKQNRSSSQSGGHAAWFLCARLTLAADKFNKERFSQVFTDD